MEFYPTRIYSMLTLSQAFCQVQVIQQWRTTALLKEQSDGLWMTRTQIIPSGTERHGRGRPRVPVGENTYKRHWTHRRRISRTPPNEITDEMLKRWAGSRQAKRGREDSTRSQSRSKGTGVNENHGAGHQKLSMASTQSARKRWRQGHRGPGMAG